MGAILSELKKALTTTGSGEALLPYDLDSVLHEELLKLQPLAQLLSVIQAEGKTHEYRVKTSHPMAWFEGETTGPNYQNGAYQRKTVQLKIQRIWGSVTGFAQAVDEKFINALAEELSGSLEGMSNLFEYGVMHGCADDVGFTGDALQFTGLVPRLFALAPTNVVDAGGQKVTLDMLDQAMAKAAMYRQTRNDPKLWFMGLRMKQVVDGLQTKVQLPLTTAELADGKIVMDAYAKAPIYETDYLVPEDTTTSPAVSAAAAAGGNMPAATWNYRLSSVTMFGEQVGGTASSNVTTDTTNKKVNLTWTPDANAKLYMVWRKQGAGAWQLLDIIAALTYDGDGKVNGTVATYTDDGSKTAKAVKPLESGEQQILLADINPNRGLAFVGMIDDMGRPIDRLVSFVELARVKDSFDYMLKSYLTARVLYPNLASIVRHVKLS
jgi:hypothetical protein